MSQKEANKLRVLLGCKQTNKRKELIFATIIWTGTGEQKRGVGGGSLTNCRVQWRLAILVPHIQLKAPSHQEGCCLEIPGVHTNMKTRPAVNISSMDAEKWRKGEKERERGKKGLVIAKKKKKQYSQNRRNLLCLCLLNEELTEPGEPTSTGEEQRGFPRPIILLQQELGSILERERKKKKKLSRNCFLERNRR